MIKKFTDSSNASVYSKVAHSLKYGGLHHFFMMLTLIYAVFNCFTGTLFHTDYYELLKESVTTAFLVVVLLELMLNFLFAPKVFFKSSWNLFQIGFVVFSIYHTGLLLLMTFRFIIYLYTFVDHPVIKRVIHTFVHSIPTLIMSSSLLMVCLTCYALLTTSLFGKAFPDLFGDISISLFTLVQLMTFDDWMGYILRPVMEQYFWSWPIFISFVILIVFGILNVFIGAIVSAMNFVDDAEDKGPRITDLQNQLAELKELVQTHTIVTKSK